ncbi:MAG: GAF domain-containing protein [bacterium]|nr:GAF domain-containing protein [bacterium]
MTASDPNTGNTPRPAPGAPRPSSTVADELHRTNALLDALSKVHLAFIGGLDRGELFERLQGQLLELTESEYGFIGEVHFTEEGQPFLQTHAITNIAWDAETRRFYEEHGPQGMLFTNLQTLFGVVMTSGEPVIANTPADDPRAGGTPQGHPALNAFLGLPFYKGDEMIGMIGMANRPGGYDEELVRWLEPVLVTCATLIESHRNERSAVRAEQELRKQAAELRDTNATLGRRNEELAEFTHLAHHDLCEPLRLLRTYGELLRRDAGEALPVSAQTDLDFLMYASERMQDLVHGLLALFRTGSVELDPRAVSLDACVDEALARLADELNDARVRVERDALPDVWADGGLVTRVYENLIRNALSFAGKPSPVIRLTADVDGDRVRLGVADDGVGIHPGHVESVFAPFKRLHIRSDVPGTGIGLTICRKAVERHGGTIWVEPSSAGGAHVRFTLERADPAAA